MRALRRGSVACAIAWLSATLVVHAVGSLSPPPAVEPDTAAVRVVRSGASDRDLTLVVRSGDTLSRLFQAHALSGADLHAILGLGGSTRRLKELHPGDRLLIQADPAGRVERLRIALDESRALEVERGARGFAARSIEQPVERRMVAVRGTIDSSLFASASAAGLSGALTMSLAGIFGYDIDFLQDLRRGDGFEVLYEELWREGEKLRDGPILAARFDNDGRALTAVRFAATNGVASYYSPDGASMRKALTRNPVDFTRISSGFSFARRHPVLNKVRAHQGVDYAAPTGTPVRAAGDGKIVFRGVRGGYGNAIVVQHGATYSTLYGHLSRFARGLGVGSRVVQDQVIGYVGKTGLATAPHLHYEVLVGGVHRNPRTVKLPDAEPVPADARARFVTEVWERLNELDRRLPGEPLAGT
jgi:murein DD-endopeptidase MepM/ murein hydrolase activator NlpD